MIRFAVTDNINNLDNINIAMLDKTSDIREDSVLQLHDLSTTRPENLTPLYTDTIIAISDSSSNITNIGNKFKHGIKITDRYIFNQSKNIVIPLWYKYIPKVALNTKSSTIAINRFNVVSPGVKYKMSFADNSYVVKNNYKVYKRRYSTQNWTTLPESSYVINKSDNTFELIDPQYTNYNIKIINKTVSDPIKVYYEDGSKVENIDIELIEILNPPVDNFDNTTSLANNFYVKLMLHELPQKTLYISFQGYDGYKTFIVNPVDMYEENKDFTVNDDYSIHTNVPNTLFYIKLPNRNSILSILKPTFPQKRTWNILIPNESVSIDGHVYLPTESNVTNYDNVIRVKEDINQIAEDKIKLSYDNIYIIRGIDNKPLNIDLYSIMDDGSIISHNDIISDIDENNKILYITKSEPINKTRTIVSYQIKLDHTLIYQYNLNPHKMFNKYFAMADVIVYMLPQDEVKGNKSVFFFPVYRYYKYMDDLRPQNMSLSLAIEYITSGKVAEDIIDDIKTTNIHPLLLGIISNIVTVSANDIVFSDIRRLGTDIAYDYAIDPYDDTTHLNYTTVGYWWGKPLNFDNIAVVYIKQSLIDKLKERYSKYDLNTIRNIENNKSFDLDKYIINDVIKKKIKSKLRVGCKLLLEIVNE